MFFMTNVSISGSVVMQPAGPEKGVGVITSDYRKDQGDPAWANDPGMNEWREFMREYVPDGELGDNNYTYAYGAGTTMIQVLRQCGNDFSRENVMKQATNIAPLEIADAAARHQGQHQPDQLQPDPPHAAPALGRPVLAALRQRHRGRAGVATRSFRGRTTNHAEPTHPPRRLGGYARCPPRLLRAQPATPGVTATEIKIGNIMPYSGPASA